MKIPSLDEKIVAKRKNIRVAIEIDAPLSLSLTISVTRESVIVHRM